MSPRTAMPAQPAVNRCIQQAPDNREGLSFRAKRGICFFLSLFACIAASSHAQTKRPAILGIASVSIVAESESAYNFYSKQLALSFQGKFCASICISSFGVNPRQGIEVLNRRQWDALTGKPVESNLVNITFLTSSVETLREYLKSIGLRPSDISKSMDGTNRRFWLADPEGLQIGFIQNGGNARYIFGESHVSKRLVHIGCIVRDRAAMEHFYKEILGFRPYWHGGMKDDQTDWESFQVPDGTDWVEFMVNVPENPDQRLRGIMNHIALGVPDIHAAQKQLLTNGVKLTEEPKLGRDGKWQLNLYDPDQSRIEFMEFTPKEKPCCSEYTGPHPKP